MTLDLPAMTYETIISQARRLAQPFSPSDDCRVGVVGAVLVSRAGNTYSGVCLEFECGIGVCAEHSAIAELVKAHESRIALIVAVDHDGQILSPCGRCREMIWQLDKSNLNTLKILGVELAKPLRELLPFR